MARKPETTMGLVMACRGLLQLRERFSVGYRDLMVSAAREIEHAAARLLEFDTAPWSISDAAVMARAAQRLREKVVRLEKSSQDGRPPQFGIVADLEILTEIEEGKRDISAARPILFRHGFLEEENTATE